MSNRQNAVTALVVVALILSGVNTYLLQANLSTQQRVNEEQAKSLHGLQSSVTALSQTAQSLQSKLDAASTTIGSLNTSLNALNTENSANSNKITGIAGALAQVSSDVSSLKTQAETLSGGIKDLQEAVSQESSSTKELAGDLGALSGKLEQHLKASPSEIFTQSYKSVVVIRTSQALGSGFIYDNGGRIATNWHVVQGSTEVEVEYYDGTRSKAMVLGSDAYSDTAIIDPATRPADAKPLPLGDSSKCYIGQEVVAIGNPLGLSSSLSSGIVSQVNREVTVEDVPLVVVSLQIDVTIAPGNSGGPLLDMNGRVLGLNNAASDFGFNFAIPINVAKRAIDSIIAKGRYDHPFFGFSSISLNPDIIKQLGVTNIAETQTGLIVLGVVDGSPAKEAGLTPAVEVSTPGGTKLEARDIVVALDGHPIRTRADLVVYVEEYVSPDQEVTFTLWRSGAQVDIKIRAKARDPYAG